MLPSSTRFTIELLEFVTKISFRHLVFVSFFFSAQPPANGNLFTAEAYMVSVDHNHKPELSEQLKKYHPGIKISDMEQLTNEVSSPTRVGQPLKNGHAKQYSNGVVIDEEETSFVNGNRNGHHVHKNNNNQPTTPISVGQYYGSKSSIKNNSAPSLNGSINFVENNNNNINNNSTKLDNELNNNERLKKYELDLQKRRQAEEQQAKEEEFLR